MAIDPNIYALSIQLDLDTNLAQDKLDLFDDDILKIEHKVADVAQRAIGQVEDSGTKAVKSLDNMKSVLDSLEIAGTNAATALDAGKNLNDSMNLFDDINQLVEDEFELLKDVHQLFDDIQEALRKKNLLHEEELGLVEKENKAVDGMSRGWVKVGVLITGVIATANKLAGVLARISEDTEKFTNANYRLYGSQMQLLNATRMLTAETGVFYETALEAMLVLGDLRVPRNELEQYAKMIGMMNRVTGVSVPTLAKYAVNLRQIGRTADQVEEHLLGLQENMRKFSLDAESMSKILDGTTLSVHDLDLAFEGTGNIEKYTNMKIELTALGKAFGMASFSANEFDSILADPIGLLKFSETLNTGPIRTVEDFQKAIMHAAEDTNGVFQRMARAMELGEEAGAAARMEMEAYAKSAGLSKAATDYMLTLARHVNDDKSLMKFYRMQQQGAQLTADQEQKFNELLKARNLDKASVGGYVKQLEQYQKASGGLLKSEQYRMAAMEHAKKSAMDPFAEANDTLIAQLRILRQRIGALIARAWEPLERALMSVLKWVNWMIDGLIWLGNAFYDYIYKPLNDLTGGLLGQFLDWIWVGVVALGLLVLALGAVAITLGFVPNLIRMFTRAIVGFFRGLGMGIAAFAKAVAAHTITLLQLAVAFAMVGAGMWLMAQAFQIITQRGWEGIAMFAVLMVVMIAFIVALVVVAAFATAAIPALLAIGVAVALIGLGFMMAAIGVWIMAQSLQLIALFGLDAALGLIALAGALAVLAAVGFFLIAPLFAVAGALWAIAIPVFILGLGFMMLATAIGMLSFDAVTQAAYALLVGASIMLLAAVILVPAAIGLAIAGVLLVIAAALLLAGSVILIVAAAVFIVAAVILAVGAAIFFGAAFAIFVGGLMIFLAGTMILIGALAMVAGLYTLMVAAGLMFGAAAALWAGSWALSAGAAAILPAAAAIFAAGLLLLVGATMFYIGAALLYYGGLMFSMTGALLQAGSKAILGAAEDMVAAVNMLILFGVLAMQAGYAMAFGATVLISASVILMVSAIFLMGVTWVLGIAAAALVVTGFLLYLGSLWIGMAIANMARQSDDFYKFAGAMGQIAEGIHALMALKPRSIVDVANALSVAAPKMKKAVKELEGIGEDFNKAFSGFDPDQTEILKLAPILNKLSASLDAVDISTGPLDKIRTSLDLINEAIIQLDDNADELVKNLSDFGPMLEQQAEQIEIAAQRIQEAIENRGIPAMRAAQDAGLAAVQQGDVIATVQVMPNQEGRERSREEELNEARNAHLARLIELLEGLTGQEDLKNINELLAAVLPGLGGNDSSNLHNAMNNWTG
jgi:hypothetical protein